MISPTMTRGSSTLITSRSTAVAYAAISASAVRTADPIAKPLPVAAVVFPSESSASVLSRTSSGSWAIWAMPPALSATGP
jgi:hypothetical protein